MKKLGKIVARQASKGAIFTVDVPSREAAAKIASERHNSAKERAEFSRMLVQDAKSRASASLRK